MGQQAAFVARMRATVLGVLCLLATAFLLLLVWGSWMVAAQHDCHGGSALGCMGSLLGTVQVYGWGWFGMWVLWFVVVWLWTGDPRKRVLVYGVWYHQERVARAVNRQLRAQGLATLPRERLYGLEDSIVHLLRANGWLEQDQSPSSPEPEGKASPHAKREHMLAEVQRALAERGVAESEQAAVGLLVDSFLAQAQQAQELSPLRRGWIGRVQAAKLGVYGKRAL
jgi:hypothetical protein